MAGVCLDDDLLHLRSAPQARLSLVAVVALSGRHRGAFEDEESQVVALVGVACEE